MEEFDFYMGSALTGLIGKGGDRINATDVDPHVVKGIAKAAAELAGACVKAKEQYQTENPDNEEKTIKPGDPVNGGIATTPIGSDQVLLPGQSSPDQTQSQSFADSVPNEQASLQAAAANNQSVNPTLSPTDAVPQDGYSPQSTSTVQSEDTLAPASEPENPPGSNETEPLNLSGL